MYPGCFRGIGGLKESQGRSVGHQEVSGSPRGVPEKKFHERSMGLQSILEAFQVCFKGFQGASGTFYRFSRGF